LEARTKGPAARSSKSRPAGNSPQSRRGEGGTIQAQPAVSPQIESIEFRSIAAFERDLDQLATLDRRRVIKTVNAKCQLWLKDRRKAETEFLRPCRFRLRGGLESSLCELPVGKERTVILTVDDDPIFGQVIITLMRLVPKGGRKAAYDELAKSLYPGQILEVQTSKDQ
jgi:hypothetical protein